MEIVIVGVVVIILLVVLIIVGVFMLQRKDNEIEEILKKYARTSTSGTSVVEKFDPIPSTDKFYKDFKDLLPEKYKNKLKCDTLNQNVLDCIMRQYARDPNMDMTIARKIALMYTLKEFPDMIIYNPSNSTVTMHNKVYTIKELEDILKQNIMKELKTEYTYTGDCNCT